MYFGNLTVDKLVQLLNGNLNWNDAFGWITPEFLQNFGFQTFFTFLTPQRLQLLQGGYFDVNTLNWVTKDGINIVPGNLYLLCH